MQNEEAQTTPELATKFPLRIFVIAFLLSILTTCLMLWQSHLTSEAVARLESNHVALSEHVGKVLLYDEVLTMSARQCAATKDFAYEARYNVADHELTKAIAALRTFVPSAEIDDLVAQTDSANAQLIVLERDAFALTHAGRGEEALALLSSADYAELKQHYSKGMSETTAAANRAIALERQSIEQRTVFISVGSVIGIVGLIVAWLAAVRAARAWVAMRARAEEESQRHLEEVEREKDEFLATINHSLKTPLNHILGFGELLKSGSAGELSAQQEEFVGTVCTAATAQLAIINSLVELAELQTRRTSLKIQAENPRLVLGVVATEFSASARESGVVLSVDPTTEERGVEIDRRVVAKVLRVFMANAIQFSPLGGEITLSARRTRCPTAFGLSSRTSEEYLEFSVADCGIGIAPNVVSRLFRPFIQGDGRLARSHQGTGIGLTLARKLAELHHGDCTVASSVGEGSTFSLWIPIQPLAEHAC